jgi:hypothetical protein
MERIPVEFRKSIAGDTDKGVIESYSYAFFIFFDR